MNRQPRRRYDAIVAGAGVVGCACAYNLARSGLTVLVVDGRGVCSGASGANPGFLVLSYRESKLALELALESMRMLPSLERELESDFEYEHTGGIIPVKSEREAEAVGKLFDIQRGWGLERVRMVTAAEATRLEPALDREYVRAAGYCEDEGRINPFRLALAFADGARRLGATVRPGVGIGGFSMGSGRPRRIDGVLLTDGESVQAGVVVNATGAWAGALASMAGVDLDIRYHRGEALVTEATPPLIRGIVTDGEFFVGYHDTSDMRTGACLTQAESGNVVIAQATTEVGTYERRNTYQGLREVCAKAARYFPGLASLSVIRTWAAVTPYTVDRLPAFGFVEEVPNLLMAASFPSAVGLSPIVGRLAAELVTTGRTAVDLSTFAPDRLKKRGSEVAS